MPEVQFSSLRDFLDMGGYALYVWPAYALFGLFAVLSLMQPKLARKRILKQLRARLEREDKP